ncbi:MAG: amidohydrolase [Anaerolineae bacterium]|nr:amidohydrolase [Anaerolineae bacterium]
MNLRILPVDTAFYAEKLDYLPARMLDIHTHVWLRAHRQPAAVARRGPTWPGRVADQNPIGDLLQTYRLMLPKQSVTPVIFGPATQEYDLDASNHYISEVAVQHQLPSFLVTRPEWSGQELEQRVVGGGFLGLKPYLEWAPPHIASDDITIFDFLPYHHLQVANEHGWIVMLHIPRRGRLRDPLNLEMLLEIEQRYPGVRLVIAHIGRAYCPEDVGDAFEVLRDARRMHFDFCANTSAYAMEHLLRAVGPQRVVFGSDMPVVRMRMRRICEQGFYVNLVPRGLYGDISDDPHMREVDGEEGAQLSFFLYEELLAFRQAAEAVGLSADDVADVMYNNAARLIAAAGGRII